MRMILAIFIFSLFSLQDALARKVEETLLLETLTARKSWDAPPSKDGEKELEGSESISKAYQETLHQGVKFGKLDPGLQQAMSLFPYKKEFKGHPDIKDQELLWAVLGVRALAENGNPPTLDLFRQSLQKAVDILHLDRHEALFIMVYLRHQAVLVERTLVHAIPETTLEAFWLEGLRKAKVSTQPDLIRILITLLPDFPAGKLKPCKREMKDSDVAFFDSITEHIDSSSAEVITALAVISPLSVNDSTRLYSFVHHASPENLPTIPIGICRYVALKILCGVTNLYDGHSVSDAELVERTPILQEFVDGLTLDLHTARNSWDTSYTTYVEKTVDSGTPVSLNHYKFTVILGELRANAQQKYTAHLATMLMQKGIPRLRVQASLLLTRAVQETVDILNIPPAFALLLQLRNSLQFSSFEGTSLPTFCTSEIYLTLRDLGLDWSPEVVDAFPDQLAQVNMAPVTAPTEGEGMEALDLEAVLTRVSLMQPPNPPKSEYSVGENLRPKLRAITALQSGHWKYLADHGLSKETVQQWKEALDLLKKLSPKRKSKEERGLIAKALELLNAPL